MVGHTAIREAVIKAVEALDREVGRVLDAAQEENYSVIVTADHGNCEQLIDPETGEPHTQHTTNPVPIVFCDDALRGQALRPMGILADVAPTLLELAGAGDTAPRTGRLWAIAGAKDRDSDAT